MGTLKSIGKYSERPQSLSRYGSAYDMALKNGDRDAADEVIGELVTGEYSLADIYTALITPALASIGESWCARDIGIGQEKLATQIVLNQMDWLRAKFVAPQRRSSFRVMVACVEGETHSIAARMFADLCLARGWWVDSLGPDVPSSAIVDMVRRRYPQLLALSLTMDHAVEHAKKLAADLKVLSVPPRLLLGGQAAQAIDARARAQGAFEIAGDLNSGVEFAANLQRSERPKTILREYLTALGKRVRELRTDKGWTQEQLAERTKVTRVCIVAVEGGKQNLSMDIVVRLANALAITPEALLTSDDEHLQWKGGGV